MFSGVMDFIQAFFSSPQSVDRDTVVPGKEDVKSSHSARYAVLKGPNTVRSHGWS